MNSNRAENLRKRTMHTYGQHIVAGLKIENIRRITMWTKPVATEMRFGFEVTMYVMNK